MGKKKIFGELFKYIFTAKIALIKSLNVEMLTVLLSPSPDPPIAYYYSHTARVRRAGARWCFIHENDRC